MWKAGAASLTDLEEKFKKDRSTLIRLFKSEGAVKGETAEEAKKKVEEAVAQTLVSDATVLAERIKSTKEESYKIATVIQRTVGALIAKAKQENRSFATLANDMKALQLAANTVKIAREERYVSLGIHKDDEHDDKPLPELEIRELTLDDIKKMHQAQVVQDETGLTELDMGDDPILDETDDRVEID